MARRHKSSKTPEAFLFPADVGSLPAKSRDVGVTEPIWTSSKALLIERYLYYFVLITKHGTYIDGFAGPQRADRQDAWAAKRVVESDPKWLRHIHLFDRSTEQVARLHQLRDNAVAQGDDREITVTQGDFNVAVHEFLNRGSIAKREATFCLLDQRTFECKWSTVAALAAHKRGMKIELFYFLPYGWFARAVSALKDKKMMQDWWGRDDWATLIPLKGLPLSERFEDRFRKELRYAHVQSWPIYNKKLGIRKVMYWMIHASDHRLAPQLMERAYAQAVRPKEPQQSLLDYIERLSRDR